MRALLFFVIVALNIGASGKYARSYTDYCADANNVVCMRMNDNNNGKVVDDGGKIIVGLVTSATYDTACQEGGCFEFDGATGILNLGSSSAVDDIAQADHTFVAWMNADTIGEGGSGRLLDKRPLDDSGGYLMGTFGTAQVFAQTIDATGFIEANYISNTNAFTLGTWTHFAAVFTQSTKVYDLYINGVEVTYATATAGSTTAGSDADGNLSIGNRTADNRTFDGHIDEIALFSRALTATEIKDIYENGLK